MGMYMESCDDGMRLTSTPHAVNVSVNACTSSRSRLGSLGRLVDSFWPERSKAAKDDGDREGELGHYGSILFDFEFGQSQTNSYSEKKELPKDPDAGRSEASAAAADKKASKIKSPEKSVSNQTSASADAGDSDCKWMNFSQRPTSTQPVPIPRGSHYHTHNFERIEAIYI